MSDAMQFDSAAILEFEGLLAIVAGYCQSEIGRDAVLRLRPSLDRAWIEREHALCGEVRAYLRTGAGFDFGGLTPVDRLLQRARIDGALLELDELREVLRMAARASEWREVSLHPPVELREGWPLIEEMGRRILDFRPLVDYFKGKLAPDGSLEDDASPTLRSIRREIERQRQRIHSALGGMMRRLNEDGVARDDLITVRGERFVIPVKVEQKRRVAGVIHGASSSGQTVYVEPMETIEHNNELLRLLEEEQAEIARILRDMCRRIGENAAAIAEAAKILAEMEMQFAKARYAEAYAAVPLRVIDDAAPISLSLREARHPTLEHNLRARGKSAVPLTLELKRDERQLVISGPNTGGKTVSLKTVGLLVLAAQAGLPLTAERAELPIFDAVLADIGDYQSIEQNLSTFSAHVTNINRISHAAGARSLVLLDELGSATDPEEGAALAVAIAEHFLRLGAVSLISTHHTALKVHAENAVGVVNAAVGFDEATLAPTYELKVGVPGASAGVNIAQKLGLNPLIVDEARRRLGRQTQDVAKFLDSLHAELKRLDAERAETRELKAELEAERRRLAQEGANEQKKLQREMSQKLESLLRDFEYHARESVNAIQDRAEKLKLGKEAERRIAKARREFQEQFNSAVAAHVAGADRSEAHEPSQAVARVSEGDTVQLKSLGRTAKVTRKIDDRTLEVQAGVMKMRASIDDVAAVVARAADNPVAAARAKGVTVLLSHENDEASSELNVIGMTADEAEREVEKFVDRAFLAGLTHVRIVHGSGMGILRKSIRRYLTQHPQVVKVSEPPQNMGGGGATEVELKA